MSKGSWSKEHTKLAEYHFSVYDPVGFKLREERTDGGRMAMIDELVVIYPYRHRRMDIKWLRVYDESRTREYYWNIKWIKPEER